eukprot:Pgem_evm1s5468
MTFLENVILRSSKEYQLQNKLDFQCETLPFDYQLPNYFHDFDPSFACTTKLVAIRERNHRDDREVYCTYGMASVWVPFLLVPEKSMDDMRKAIKEI